MALAPIDPKNPLSAIGRSNAQSLGARAEAAHKGTMDLQRSLAALNLQGQNADRLAGINNASLERRTAMPLGLNPGGSNYLSNLGQIGTDISGLRGAETRQADATAFDRDTAAHLNLGKIGAFGKILPDTVAGDFGPEMPIKAGIPIATGAAAASVPKLQSQIETTKKTSQVEYVPGVGLIDVDKGTRTLQIGTSKGPPVAARVKYLHDLLSDQFKETGITFKKIEILAESDTHIAIKLDGDIRIVKIK